MASSLGICVRKKALCLKVGLCSKKEKGGFVPCQKGGLQARGMIDVRGASCQGYLVSCTEEEFKQEVDTP